MAKEISAEMVQKLREATSAGVMDCRKALIEANGDFEKAMKFIQERGLAKVEKRSGRETGAGLVQSYVHNGRIGVLLEMRAETDFVVRSEPFQQLAKEIAMQISATNPQSLDELFAQEYIRDSSKTIKGLVNDVIAKVGENISISQFFRIEV